MSAALPPTPGAQATYRFGSFELRPHSRELLRRGAPLEIEPKVLDLLVYLVEHRDRTVPKRELLDALWPDVAVADGVVHRCVSRARRTLGDGNDRARFIATHGRRGYQFATEVRALRADASSVLVGRDAELAAIRRAVGRVVDERRRSIISLTGEAGIGKSRLLEEFVAHARARGVLVLEGPCSEVAGAPALWPWVQMIRQLGAQPDFAALATEIGAASADVAAVVPDLGVPAKDRAERVALSADQERFRFFDSAVRMFTAAARRRPIAIVIDDLHRADDATLTLWRIMVEDASRAPIGLAYGCRSDELLSNRLLTSATACPGRGDEERIHVGGLTRGEADLLAERLLGGPISVSLGEALFVRSQGNPFFIEELASYARERARTAGMTLDLDQLFTRDEIVVPTRLQAVISQRLAGVTPRCRSVLDQAAVIGREFSAELLRATVRLGWDEAAAALDEAQCAGLIAGGPDRYRFRHVLIRDVLYDAVGPNQRAESHRRVAGSLDDGRESPGDEVIDALAHHFVAAGADEARRARRWSLRAAAAASKRLACEETAAHLEHALAAAEHCDDSTEDARCELLLQIGEAFNRAGDAIRSGAAFDSAAVVARRTSNSDQLARAAIGAAGVFGRVAEVGVDRNRTVELLQEALAVLPPSPTSQRALVLSGLSYAVWARQDLPRAAALAAEGEDTARISGDPFALSVALLARRLAGRRPGGLDDGSDTTDELTEAADASGVASMQVQARLARAYEAFENGRDVYELDQAIRAHSDLAEHLREPYGVWWSHVLSAARALMHGDCERAEHLHSLARNLGRRSGNANMETAYLSQLAQVQLHRAEFGPLLKLSRDLTERFPSISTMPAGYMALCAGLGMLDEPRRYATEWHGRDLATSLFATDWLIHAAFLADMAFSVSDEVLGAQLFAFLEPHRDRNIVAGRGITYNGPASRPVALLAWLLGHHDRARDHFEHAIARARAFDALPFVGRSQLSYARMLRELDGPGDSARSREFVREARAAADRVGYLPVRYEIELHGLDA